MKESTIKKTEILISITMVAVEFYGAFRSIVRECLWKMRDFAETVNLSKTVINSIIVHIFFIFLYIKEQIS